MRRFVQLEHSRFDIENRVSYRLSRLARRMQRNVGGMFRAEHRVPLIGWQVLSIVGRFEPVSAKEVTARTELPPDQVSRMVDVLAARGWVARRRNTEDRRRLALVLRPPGRRVFDHTELFIRLMNQELLRGFSPSEQHTLDRLLEKLEKRSYTVLDRDDSWVGLLAMLKAR